MSLLARRPPHKDIQGPDFQAWDFKFGLIGQESGARISNAIQNGTLDNRAVSCKVVHEITTLVYPLPPEPVPSALASSFPPSPARYGLTFEYTTTKPHVPFSLVITYPSSPGGGENNGWLPGETTGKTGRFCFYQYSNDPEAQISGTRCYQVTIEGVPLPEICAHVINVSAP